MNEQEFAELFLKKLKIEFPNVNFEITGRLKIDSKLDDFEHTYFLDNSYSEYKRDPKELEEIISRYINSARSLYAPPTEIDIYKIVPTIKPMDYLNELKELTKEEPYIVYEKYNDHLIIVYAEDTEASIKYFNNDDFAKLNISRDTLLEFSKDNLRKVLPEVQIVQADNEVYGLLAGGVYEASFILFEKIWTKENFPVQGDFIMSMPNRDILFVTGSENKEGIKGIKKSTEDLFNNGDHPVSPYLFIMKNEKFERYNK